MALTNNQKRELLTPISSHNSQNLTLRGYQSEVISHVYEKFDAGKISILLYAPTGAGKTIIAAKIIADWVNQGKRVLFLVHRGKLVHQTRDKLSKFFGIEPSIIWRDFYEPDYSNPVQIAMLQTLQNRELPPDIDLVILDEAHTGSYYKIWQRIMVCYSGGVVALSKTKFLGLSASPWRSKTDQGYCHIPTKTCPQCDSLIANYEKICPFCGYIFDSEKKNVRATKRKFEEILSQEQQQQFRFLKVRAVNAYNKCKPIDNLDNLFEQEFNYNPPMDWYDGLIFNNDSEIWGIHVQHYWRYLLEIIPNPGSPIAKEQIQGLIKREFKSAIQRATEHFQKSFTQKNVSPQEVKFRVSERIASLINYKPWWIILDLKSPPDANYLDFTYKESRFKYESTFALKPKLLQAQMELIGIAIGEGIDYHSQDEAVIEKSIVTVKHAILHKSFSFVKSFVGRLNSTAKLRVWNGLNIREKQAYRKWQEKNNSEISENTEVASSAIKQVSEIEVKSQNHVNQNDEIIDRDNLFKLLSGEINDVKANVNNSNTTSVKNQPNLILFPERRANTSTSTVENPNPHNLRVWEKVASNKPDSPAYNWCGRITRMHPTNPEICYVNYPERKSLLNLNATEISCRFEDLRRI
ncbi:DEAD/DEAH box helicase [Brunnivagina elsteri]|uniref:DEAD/DEAH box helicase n=1 Tax=Brunnivagina elsteri TaxID=1247191 RepID=UPI00130421EE|nr:DEAD/DEAH box helicase family protein [Calothrix elsteri]